MFLHVFHQRGFQRVCVQLFLLNHTFQVVPCFGGEGVQTLTTSGSTSQADSGAQMEEDEQEEEAAQMEDEQEEDAPSIS